MVLLPQKIQSKIAEMAEELCGTISDRQTVAASQLRPTEVEVRLYLLG